MRITVITLTTCPKEGVTRFSKCIIQLDFTVTSTLSTIFSTGHGLTTVINIFKFFLKKNIIKILRILLIQYFLGMHTSTKHDQIESIYLKWNTIFYTRVTLQHHLPESHQKCLFSFRQTGFVHRMLIFFDLGILVKIVTLLLFEGSGLNDLLTLIFSLIILSSASSSNSFWGYTSIPLARSSSLIW